MITEGMLLSAALLSIVTTGITALISWIRLSTRRKLLAITPSSFIRSLYRSVWSELVK